MRRSSRLGFSVVKTSKTAKRRKNRVRTQRAHRSASHRRTPPGRSRLAQPHSPASGAEFQRVRNRRLHRDGTVRHGLRRRQESHAHEPRRDAPGRKGSGAHDRASRRHRRASRGRGRGARVPLRRSGRFARLRARRPRGDAPRDGEASFVDQGRNSGGRSSSSFNTPKSRPRAVRREW